MLHISIHAPLAGCDRYGGVTGLQRLISIHAPLAGCDLGLLILGCRINHFNPRTPCGVRRYPFCPQLGTPAHFNPRTPCGVRRGCMNPSRRFARISIHAPLAGCDYLRPPRRRRCEISIHAPLAGCDPRRYTRTHPECYFNPRTPCGVRPPCILWAISSPVFQSTHPLRGATKRCGNPA